MGNCKEDRVRLISVIFSERPEAISMEKIQEIPCGHKKLFSCLECQPLEQVALMGCGLSSLEILKRQDF